MRGAYSQGKEGDNNPVSRRETIQDLKKSAQDEDKVSLLLFMSFYSVVDVLTLKIFYPFSFVRKKVFGII
jgi:hypothetical protein